MEVESLLANGVLVGGYEGEAYSKLCGQEISRPCFEEWGGIPKVTPIVSVDGALSIP